MACFASIYGSVAQAGVACRPFRVHRFAPFPTPASPETATLTEADLLNGISKIAGQTDFKSIFEAWLTTRDPQLNAEDRRSLLECVHRYTSLDSDKDGEPDWTAIVDGHFSTTLYPFDEDIDGDGIPNVLDPDPFKRSSPKEYRPGVIPAHLKMSGVRGRLQAVIFQRFGLLAIDHSDRHSVIVLRELLELLDHGLPQGLIARLPHLKYIYASYAHDPEVNIAGYHYQARSLSIGGESSYPSDESTPLMRASILAALAHELGHAFLLGAVTPPEAQKIASSFGSWGSVLGETPLASFFDSRFFRALQGANGGTNESPNTSSSRLPSRYAATNVHEWFADCFAAFVLGRFAKDKDLADRLSHLPKVQLLNKDWLKTDAEKKPIFAWLENKLRPTKDAAP